MNVDSQREVTIIALKVELLWRLIEVEMSDNIFAISMFFLLALEPMDDSWEHLTKYIQQDWIFSYDPWCRLVKIILTLRLTDVTVDWLETNCTVVDLKALYGTARSFASINIYSCISRRARQKKSPTKDIIFSLPCQPHPKARLACGKKIDITIVMCSMQ